MLTVFMVGLMIGASPSYARTELWGTEVRASRLNDVVAKATGIVRKPQTSRKKTRQRKPDVIYYPTPPETVAEMLRLANIKQGDVLYDLGSGDGRIPIAAAKEFGIRAVGIEIDPKLITEADANARSAGVEQLVRFRNEDMFRIDVSEATVVTLYLSEKLNVLLRPKLLRELHPGSRIISHDFRMGDWKPEQTVRVPWGKLYRTVYLWTVPARRKKIRWTMPRPKGKRELDHVGKILAGTCKPPVTEEKADERESREIGEPGPIRRRAFNQDTPVAANQWSERIEVHKEPIARGHD
jgi:tRNA A58 N-methylase Trm61